MPLPLYAAFFRRVDLRELRVVAVEEVAFDVVEQERLSVGIREVQTIVIDDLRLLL